MIDAQQFQRAFYEWVQAVWEITLGQIVNLDGKCLRGSEDARLGKRAIYMVSAWAEANQLVLRQRKVDEKSNEIIAIPELLKQEKTAKVGIHARQLQAALREDYLLKVLAAGN